MSKASAEFSFFFGISSYSLIDHHLHERLEVGNNAVAHNLRAVETVCV